MMFYSGLQDRKTLLMNIERQIVLRDSKKICPKTNLIRKTLFLNSAAFLIRLFVFSHPRCKKEHFIFVMQDYNAF